MTGSNKSIHILKIIKSDCVSFRKNSIYFQNEITTFSSAMQMIIKFANAFIIYELIHKVLIAQPSAKFKNNNKYVKRGKLNNVP